MVAVLEGAAGRRAAAAIIHNSAVSSCCCSFARAPKTLCLFLTIPPLQLNKEDERGNVIITVEYSFVPRKDCFYTGRILVMDL